MRPNLGEFLDDRFLTFSQKSVILNSVKWLREEEKTLSQLRELLTSLREIYSLLNSVHSGMGDFRGTQEFIDILCNLNSLELKLHLPPKGLLAESFLMLKMHLFKILKRGLSEGSPAELLDGLIKEISDIIHTYLLGQLLIDLLLNSQVEEEIRQLAAHYLLKFWEECSKNEDLSDFFQYIHALWDARVNVQVKYGSLLGTSELIQLIEAKCPSHIINFFTEQGSDTEESQAFQEFLFGLSYEQIQILLREMELRGLSAISPREVKKILQATPDREFEESGGPFRDPHLVYRSYKQRRLWARHRKQNNLPGPKRTAEEFLILHLLRNHKRESDELASSKKPTLPTGKTGRSPD